MIRVWFALFASLAAFNASPVAEPPDMVDPAWIDNYRLVRHGLALAGRLKPDGISKIRSLGFKTIINVRTEKEGAKDEEAAVVSQGLRYVWIPVTPESLTLSDIENIHAVIEDPNASPVLLHCASGNRVGGVWALLQVIHCRDLEQAVIEGRQLGLRSATMIHAVRRLAPEATVHACDENHSR